MQAQLFSPALEYKEQALQAMRACEWEAAWQSLQVAHEIDPFLADLELLAHLCEFARHESETHKSSLQNAVGLWHAADAALLRGDLHEAEVRQLRRLLARHLLEVGASAKEVFHAKDKALLRGVCHLVLENWQAAHADLLNWVTQEHAPVAPRAWGYFGDAATALKLRHEANLAYVRALFLAPHEIDRLTFQHAQLTLALLRLEMRYENAALARSLWPFEAWRRQLIQIPLGNTFLLPVLQRRRSLLGSELMLEREQTLRQFMLCLYIDQAKLQGRIDFNVREEMLALEPELFRQYLAEVAMRS